MFRIKADSSGLTGFYSQILRARLIQAASKIDVGLDMFIYQVKRCEHYEEHQGAS